jgi:hypothetical protein
MTERSETLLTTSIVNSNYSKLLFSQINHKENMERPIVTRLNMLYIMCETFLAVK